MTIPIAPEPKTPDMINWEHVAPEYNFMARDKDGLACIFEDRPSIRHREFWIAGGGSEVGDSVHLFASYRRGTVDWKDSLVIRPGYEGKP